MNGPLRFAEAVCEGHPDRLADRIAARIVDLACSRDGHALVGVEVAIHRNVVFIDGRIAAGTGTGCAVREEDISELARAVFGDAGYGKSPSGTFIPLPDRLDVRMDLCLGPLGDDERAVRHVSRRALDALPRGSPHGACRLGRVPRGALYPPAPQFGRGAASGR